MRERLIVAAVIAGVAVIAALGFLVLGPGRRDLSPPSLREHPRAEIPGEILYLNSEECIVAAAASGATRRQLRCTGGVTALTWLEDGRVAYLSFQWGRSIWTVFDPISGSNEQLRSDAPMPDGTLTSVRGETAEIDQQGNLYIQSATSRDKVYTFKDLPQYSRPSVRLWSPDGEWLLLQYRDELWIVRRDGSLAGTLVSDDVYWSAVSWRIPGAGITSESLRPGLVPTVPAPTPSPATATPTAAP